jgi:integrase
MKFTNTSIKALRFKSERYEQWEDNGKGFGVRVSPSGRKSWIFMYRYEGRARRMTLGVYPKVTLADAHSAHADARKSLEKGNDPGSILTVANKEAIQAPTMSQLVDEYIEKWAKPRKRTWKEDARILNKDVIPQLGRRKSRDIKPREIILVIDKIVERGSPISAARTLRILKKMFSFAVSRGILDASPCVAIEPPAKEGNRERVLSEEEIKKFWFGLDDALMAEGTRIILKLLLVTAQRKGEVTKSEWSEIDFNTGWWTIPSSKAKNKRTHRVPLTGIAIDLLREAKELAKDSKWVFPSVKNQSITPRSISRAIRNNSKKKPKDHPKHKPPYGDFFKFEHFTPHDLRRTAATKMASLRITEHDVSKVLNQTIQTVTNKHYNHYSYDKEKQQALNKWSRKLQSIISGESPGKIVELKKR